MAKKVVGREMTSRVGLDSAEAVKSLKTLTAEVRANTSGWKAQETALKSAGEYQKAAASRVDGLAKSMEMQKSKIDELKSRQAGLNRDTKDGEEAYLKLSDQINKASRSYDSMGGQLDRAKSKLQYYNSGLADLQKGYKQSTALSESYVKRLEAEGRSAEANKAKLGGLKQAYSNMEAQYKAQTNELERIKTASGATSDAYKRQQVRVNETATAMAKQKSEVTELTVKYGTMSDKMAKLSDKAAITKDKLKTFAGGFKTLATAASASIAGVTAASVAGAEKASTLQNVYKQNQNLLTTSGDSAKSAIKAVTEMQKDGQKYSVKYGISQKEIAEQYQDLIKRGHTAKESLAVMKTELQASVASGDEFSDVTKVSSQVIEAFGMKTNNTAKMVKNTKRVVNDLAYAADTTATDFSSLGKGMEYVGDSANNAGFSVEQTSAALGELSNHGLEADKAGTGLRKMITSLASPTAVATGALKKVGITSTKAFQDSKGNFKSMSDIMSIMEKHTKNLGGAQKAAVFKAVFGATGMQAAQILAKNNKQLSSLTDKVTKAGKAGEYVQKLANKNSGTAQMNVKRFKESGEALETMMGAKLLPVMTEAANKMTVAFNNKGVQNGLKKTVNLIATLLEGTLKVVEFMGDHTKTVAGFGVALGSIWAIVKVSKFIGLLKEMKTNFGLVGDVIKGATAEQGLFNIALDANPVGITVIALAALTAGLVAAYKYIKPFRKWVNGLGNSMKKLFSGKYGWEKKVGSALGKVGNTMGKWAKTTTGFFKKHKTEILTTLINPFAGLATWFLKDTKTGKNIQKWSKGFSKDIQKMGFKKAMDKQVNDASKAFSKTKFGKWFKTVSDSFNTWKSSFKKSWNSHWSDMGKSLRNNWNGSVKNTRNFFSTVGKKWNGFKNSFRKGWNSHWNAMTSNLHSAWNSSYKHTRDFFSSMGKKWDGWKSSFRKSWNNHWNDMRSNLNHYWNRSIKHTRDFFSSMGSRWVGWKKSFAHSWNNHWDTMRSNLHSYWNKDLSHTRVFGHSMGDWLSTFKKSFKSGWSSLGTGVENIFKGLWKDLKNFAKDGMNDVIDIINGGINAVDSVIHTFGGKRKTIGDLSHVHFAEGTGRNPITKPTMAMLNDGNDSPQTGNKEMVMLPNGDSGIVQGRNTKMMLPAGSEVLSASETAMLMAMQGVTKYAKGTGFFGDILNSVTSGISGVTSWVGKKVGSLEKFFKTAENIIAHPIKSLENLFSWSSKGVSGVMSNIGHGLFNGVEKQAKTWWSTLWGGVSDSLDSGASSSTLVNAMEKYGATNKYVYGAEGPSAFDCSGLVEYTLKKLGISFPRTSGEQYKASKHVSDPKPGDLVFFGPGGSDHVGVYTGNGEFYSAENEKDGMGISKVHGGGYGSFAGYGRVPGLSDSTSSDKASKSSGLLGTIKKQVGSGFWKFISKLADEFGDGGSSNPGGSGVQRWKPDVIKALKKNGFEASASQVSAWMKVIARESNGDPTVVNNWDANARMGIPSKGLVQTIQPTFDAYKFPGHNNPLNGYDDLLAGIHYMKAKYGSGPSAFARVSGPEGYENGGIINTNQLIEVAEHNKPEMVLPLTNKSRANQLIAQASQVVNGNNGSQVASNSSESSEKLDKVIALLAALVSGQGDVQAVIAKSDVVNAVKSDNKTASQYSQMMGY
ncbi:phage tail tape measure protein [Lactiplantibacillus plantarum]|uniref:phage tail tape measure protein n=1 Tax=Lactiplantibacillus plantarum TaxID=1590 RepID=UPI0015EBA5E7|nr:phage tail tape measure protein [Lactiplantibacillus plantarum]MBA3077021.1 phage tail tape measure protein [Lactiplantibacillus plantarum]MBA3081276.1 phage tail tape measure protein [Lactiplantibacillus plantarum]MBA3082821.1 phage tail tape measure protein [Lactiplantibacillus plantarum]MDT4760798.1 phage tail tape measure protein [Lactiplantibacillus plantarum]MDY7131683.1 phage tail tape measure protein [Lactiplantibacillus plantarum]